MTDRQKINRALEIAFENAVVDGAHHKDWIIDQMVRALSGTDYDRLIADYCSGDEGPSTYEWNIGEAP